MAENTRGQKVAEQTSSSDNTAIIAITAILAQLAQLTEVITTMRTDIRTDNYAINARLKALEVRFRSSSSIS